jgi:hypothetical protein
MCHQNIKKYIDNLMTTYIPNRILSVNDVLTPHECDQLIKLVTAKGFKKSSPSGGGHGQTPQTGSRTSKFCVIDDDVIANKLWNKIKNDVPTTLKDIKFVPYMNSQTHGDEFSPVGVNDHLRFYKYDVGDYVLKHDDYRMERFRVDHKTGQYFQQMTFLTLLIYLNDDFSDGCTAFWHDYATVGTKGHCRFLRDDNFTKPTIIVKLQIGMGLISDHMIQHEGQPPTKNTKYILRTDIMHEKEVLKERVTNKFNNKNDIYSEWTRHCEPSCLNYTE